MGNWFGNLRGRRQPRLGIPPADSARNQQVRLERISFIDVQRWLANAAEGEVLILLVINLHRPDRHELRATKYLKYRYRSLNQPRRNLNNRPICMLTM